MRDFTILTLLIIQEIFNTVKYTRDVFDRLEIKNRQLKTPFGKILKKGYFTRFTIHVFFLVERHTKQRDKLLILQTVSLSDGILGSLTLAGNQSTKKSEF